MEGKSAQRLMMGLNLKLTFITLISITGWIVLFVLDIFSFPASFPYQLSKTDTATPRFIEVENGTLLYSAWFDDRQDQDYIQVLLLTSRRKNRPPLFCRFQSETNSNTLLSVASSYYEINRGSNKRYGMFVASCALPKELVGTPCYVEISIKLAFEQRSSSVVLPVGNVKNQQCTTKTNRGEYGICIPPLHGHILVDELIEFLELSQILGASYFIFYDFEISKNVSNVLNYYKDKGLVEVLSWKLPSYITQSDVHYYGQIFAMEDCLFRSMNHLDFVAFNDLDEYIVPLQYSNMSSMLRSIHKEKHCGHCFQSAKFVVSGRDRQNLLPVTQNVFNRRQKADQTHPKCVSNPKKVFEHGVHLIMQPLEGKYVTDAVDWNAARVFHYRECHDRTCKEELEEDKTMERYGQRLKQKIDAVKDIVALKFT